VIVFLPVSFLSSMAGRMLFQFGLTHGGHSGVDGGELFVDAHDVLTAAAPCGLLDGRRRSRRGFYHWIEVGYMACLRFSMRFRWRSSSSPWP